MVGAKWWKGIHSEQGVGKTRQAALERFGKASPYAAWAYANGHSLDNRHALGVWVKHCRACQDEARALISDTDR